MQNLPDYIKNRRADAPNLVDRALANVGSPRPPHISIQGNRFALVDAAGNKAPVQTLYLDVVVFDLLEHKSKMFYDPDKAWTPDSTDPPLCWSDNGIGPSSQVSAPADFETGPTCELCPQNRWGSKISKMTGEGIKACRDEQKLAVLVPGFQGVYCLTIPPNSLKPWGAYVTKFKGQGFDFTDVLTRLTFKDGVQGTLEFAPSPSPWLDPPMVDLRDKAIAAKAADLIIGRMDRPRQGALAAPGQFANWQPAVTPVGNVLAAAAQGQPMTGVPGATIAAEPARRRRRTKEEIAADAAKAADAQPAGGPATAPFRDAQPNGSGAQFGIAQGQTPGEEMKRQIDSIFGS